MAKCKTHRETYPQSQIKLSGWKHPVAMYFDSYPINSLNFNVKSEMIESFSNANPMLCEGENQTESGREGGGDGLGWEGVAN